MSAPNPVRGDVALDLGGVRHVLRPSFAALAAVEDQVAPILQLAGEAAEGQVRLAQMAAVFHHTLLCEPGAARPTAAELGEAILAEGMSGGLRAYRSLLEQVLTGHGGRRG